MSAIPFLGSGADDLALANKIYTASLTEAYRQKAILVGSPLIQQINATHSMGKSFQFLMEADIPEPETFVPGSGTLEGQPFAVEEGVITADDLIVAHQKYRYDQVNIADTKLWANVGGKLGARIARYRDRRLFRLAAIGARTAAVNKNGLNVHNGGNRVLLSGFANIGLAFPANPIGARRLQDQFAELAYQMDVDLVPREGRMIYLHSALAPVFNHMTGGIIGTPSNTVVPAASMVFSKEYTNGQNDYLSRRIGMIEGFSVMGFVNPESQNGPLPDTSTNANLSLAKYQGNFRADQTGTGNGQPIALAFAPGEPGMSPMGECVYAPLTNKYEDITRQLSHFYLAYTQTGFGVMHPWLIGSIEIAA